MRFGARSGSDGSSSVEAGRQVGTSVKSRLAQPPRSKAHSAPCALRYARAGLDASFKPTTQARDTDGMARSNGRRGVWDLRSCGVAFGACGASVHCENERRVRGRTARTGPCRRAGAAGAPCRRGFSDRKSGQIQGKAFLRRPRVVRTDGDRGWAHATRRERDNNDSFAARDLSFLRGVRLRVCAPGGQQIVRHEVELARSVFAVRDAKEPHRLGSGWATRALPIDMRGAV